VSLFLVIMRVVTNAASHGVSSIHCHIRNVISMLRDFLLGTRLACYVMAFIWKNACLPGHAVKHVRLKRSIRRGRTHSLVTNHE